MTSSFPTTSLQAVLDYLWCDEEPDYSCCPKEERHNHIFTHLIALGNWLDQQNTM